MTQQHVDARTSLGESAVWAAWLASLADGARSSPWPFPVSVLPGIGLVRNVPGPKKRRRKKP